MKENKLGLKTEIRICDECGEPIYPVDETVSITLSKEDILPDSTIEPFFAESIAVWHTHCALKGLSKISGMPVKVDANNWYLS